MQSSFWLSPAFIISISFTIAAALYAYFYLPRQMRKAYRQGLLTLARAVEAKDSGYLGHGERVAHHVLSVAYEMSLSAQETQRIEYAALLQDIGNVQVPHAYLNKTEELTPEELEVIKTHTSVGAEIVEQVKFLKYISPIIRHHHESWDGKGYPDGIRGQDIPLGSRIIAVCTAYDSMIHARAFRKPMTQEQAINELKAMSGTKYDPKVVDAFLNVLKKESRVT